MKVSADLATHADCFKRDLGRHGRNRLGNRKNKIRERKFGRVSKS